MPTARKVVQDVRDPERGLAVIGFWFRMGNGGTPGHALVVYRARVGIATAGGRGVPAVSLSCYDSNLPLGSATDALAQVDGQQILLLRNPEGTGAFAFEPRYQEKLAVIGWFPQSAAWKDVEGGTQLLVDRGLAMPAGTLRYAPVFERDVQW